MRSHPLGGAEADIACPHCGRPNEFHTGDEASKVPEDGDVSICWGCRAVRHGRAPDGMDTGGYWARSNPSLGMRITEETIARELRSMGRAGGTSDDQGSGGPI